ncbi:hypothetical protein LIG30_2650 [Burkholderia sp. lig30]|jgi:hypothetical protein|uniref:hypothetical protein n=1 Tax=Burkholderia sp. lig30 TaxID=1192124 RepID=UPI0004610F4B|nr:hypothetical protein [Burkholderia sp. lig30]KDB08126.1 hypothetical protein LIG30_2650 [Burkholderia sp. lig30]
MNVTHCGFARSVPSLTEDACDDGAVQGGVSWLTVDACGDALLHVAIATFGIGRAGRARPGAHG